MVLPAHVRVSGHDVSDLRDVKARLDRLANDADAGGLEIVDALADVWISESQRRVPVDTGQLRARTNIVSVRSAGVRAEADLQADTPYAGFVEYGTRYVAPRPFFRDGRDAAVKAADRLGARLGSEIRRSLDSGGSWNPRSLI